MVSINSQPSKESDIFLINNRFSDGEIKIFQNIFSLIDTNSKGYINKEDFDQYKHSKPNLSDQNIEFEKFLIFNNSNITFYQFLSLLSITGISLNIPNIPIENNEIYKPITSGYSRLSFIPTSAIQQQQLKQMINNNIIYNSSGSNNISPNISSTNTTPSQSNNSPLLPPLSLSPINSSSPSNNTIDNINIVPTTTTIQLSTSIETIGRGLNNNNDNSLSDYSDNKRISKLGGHRGKIAQSN